MALKVAPAVRLRELAKKDPAAAKLLEDLAGRTNNYRESTVLRAMARTGLTRREVLDAFKALEEIGVGHLKVGRKGHQTRFCWDQGYSMTDIGKVATEELDELTLIEPEEVAEMRVDDEPDELVTHAYRLRPDVLVEVRVPADFTEREAVRLSRFVVSLPA